MPLALDELNIKVIKQILLANSQKELEVLINSTLQAVEQSRVDCEVVCFLESIIKELEGLNPMKKDAQQWSNIKLARILLLRFRRKIETPAG